MAETQWAGSEARTMRPAISWGALRRLPARLWIPLLAVLLTTVTVAFLGELSAHSDWARTALLVVTGLTLGLLLLVTRLFVIEAERQEQRRNKAEQEARELEKVVETRTRELSQLSTHLQDLAEKEKSELARNLHDELGGLLTAAKMDLSWLQSRLDQPGIQERLTQLGSVLDEAMDLKRRVVEDLRPSLLDHFGLATALRAYVESTCAKAGIKSEIDIPEDCGPIARDVAIALFRIVQEGLTNILRHAQARVIRLEMVTDGPVYAFVLSDDGQGFDPKQPHLRTSHGIMGMRQRVKALGGRFALDSQSGGGTRLRVEVPRDSP